MASVPRLDGDGGRRLVPIEGQPPDLASLPPGCAFAPRCRVDPRHMPHRAARRWSQVARSPCQGVLRPCLTRCPTAPQTIRSSRVEDLKVHFPVTKGIMIQRQVATVKAVDGVSLHDPRAARRSGLVGESGSRQVDDRACGAAHADADRRAHRVRGPGHRAAYEAPSMLAVRRRMQMVYQDPYGSLNPRMTIRRHRRRAAGRARPRRRQGRDRATRSPR